MGTLTVQNSTLSGNTAGGIGGAGAALMNGPGLGVYALWWRGATATVIGCTITGNTATRGGGIAQNSMGGGLTSQDTTITGNTATQNAGGLGINGAWAAPP